MRTKLEFGRITIAKNGNPEVLKFEEATLTPNAKKGLLIEVWVMGVGFADVMAQRGGYALAPAKPFSPGYDFVGRVIDAYDSAVLNNGDFVAGLLPTMGTYTELLEVPEKYLVKVPDELPLLKVGATLLNYFTAWLMLEQKAGIKESQKIFIQGVSGGVGYALADLGKEKELVMYGTASSAKHALVKDLGAIPIDYKTQNFMRELKKECPEGVDAAFDARGGKDLLNASRLVKRGGKLICYGFSGNAFGGSREMWIGLAMLSRIALTPNGVKLRLCGAPGEVKKKPETYRKTLNMLLNMLAQKKISPQISNIFQLHEAEMAHQLMESGQQNGKIMLVTRHFKQ